MDPFTNAIEVDADNLTIDLCGYGITTVGGSRLCKINTFEHLCEEAWR